LDVNSVCVIPGKASIGTLNESLILLTSQLNEFLMRHVLEDKKDKHFCDMEVPVEFPSHLKEVE